MDTEHKTDAPTRNGPIKIFHEGSLLKEGNNLVKDWKKRWFILRDDKLTYYKKKGVNIITIRYIILFF